jgi:hypothetical protein
MRKLNVLASLSLLLLVSVIHHNHAWAFPGPWPEYIFALSQSNPDNLLVNGNMEDLPFYWRYPNHYVAGGWSRWWIDGTVLPEYDDVRPGRPYRYDGHHAQVYFKWGNNYTAGIFQVVEGVTPCTPYRLSMWGRSHSLEGAHPHTKVGLDPTGSEVTPDGAVKHGLPPLTAWSREQTELFTWEELTVEAESLGEQMTAILYASPQPGSTATHYYDTFWDAGMLVPTNFPDGKLPTPSDWQPSGFIQNLSTTFLLDKILNHLGYT